jgi:hypothetical protein
MTQYKNFFHSYAIISTKTTTNSSADILWSHFNELKSPSTTKFPLKSSFGVTYDEIYRKRGKILIILNL